MILDKELETTRNRFEVEVNAQRATLQEQRLHIDMLDAALVKTQASVERLEREVSHFEFNYFTLISIF